MGARFHGNLDPTAQEFWPAYPPALGPLLPPPPLFPLLPPPPPVFYPSSAAPVLPPATLPPTRSLLLSSVPVHASESTVRRDLEWFGDVRAVQMGRVREGIVGVHFYDLRAAHAALDHIRAQHMQHQHRLRVFFSQFTGAPPPLPPPAKGLVSGRVVWAQFVVPAFNAFPHGHNQGTLVVFNLDPLVSASALAQIFSTFGAIRETRDTPAKRHQKFVEFFDVRDAAAALVELNGKEIGGKQVTIEFSRPGGLGRRCSFPPKFPPPMASCSIRSIIPRRNYNVAPRGQPQPLVSCSDGKNSLRNVESSSIEKLSLEDRKSDEEEEQGKKCGRGSSRTKASGSQSNSNNNSSSSSRGPWKGVKQRRSLDPRYLIKEDAAVDPDSKDTTRTTLMIKNIPNKYSQKLLLNMLDNHCIHYNEQKNDPLSSYDFLYLPIDFNNKCNVGYGFVNMTSPEAALRLYKSFHLQHWEVFNSRKICEVTYARVQGLEALKEHFKNSKFACETEEYLPVVFSPPRDGKTHLSEPLPIVPALRHAGADDSTTASVLSSSPSLSSGDGYHDEEQEQEYEDVIRGASMAPEVP